MEWLFNAPECDVLDRGVEKWAEGYAYDNPWEFVVGVPRPVGGMSCDMAKEWGLIGIYRDKNRKQTVKEEVKPCT